jgi:hypothetical protein
MRLLAPLFAVAMLGTSTSAFADLLCAITSVAAARDVATGNWENTGDITFTCSAPNANPTTDASLTVYYSGLPIVNTATLPADHAVSIAPGASYGVTLDTARPDPGFTGGVNQAGSLVGIFMPAQAVPAAGSFTLRNVLLGLNGGVTAPNGVFANINVLSASGNVVLTGSPVVVITGTAPMLSSTTAPPALQALDPSYGANPAAFTSSGGIPPATITCSTAACRNAKAAFSLTVSEDHIDSWRTSLQYYNNGVGAGGTGGGNTHPTGGTDILFTFSGMLPGSMITNCVIVPPAGTLWNLSGSGIANNAGTTTFVAELQPGGAGNATNLTAIETLTLNCGTSTTTPAYLPGASTGSATSDIKVTMAPFPAAGANVPAGIGTTALTGGTPRFQPNAGVVGPVTVITFGASAAGQTTMIIPYALANIGSYDTGIALANTTKDAVFGTDAQGAAPDTSGTLTFNFYPADGSASFSITPSTGFNLGAGGVLGSGNSFIGNLSSLLKAGNNTAPFQGYIIVQANFTHAHGIAYIYGGGATDRLTAAADILTITNPLTPGAGRGAFAPITGVEQTVK